MKKIILGILFLTTLQNANSQEPRGLNALIGANFANFKTSDLKASSAGPSSFIGIGFNMGYHETYNYQLEIAYVTSSINLENNQLNNQLNNKKFGLGGTVQLGLYFNYYIIKPDEDKFYFGPQFGLYTSYGYTSSKNGFSTDDSFEPSGLDGIDLKSASIFNYGTGMGFTGAYNKFRINLRYNLGLSNVLRTIEEKVAEGRYSDNRPYSGKLSSISLTLSYRFLSKN